jgi:hypothetical protein
MVELGRSCVHPDYRNGAAIRLLWAGIGRFLAQHPDRYLIGCASVPATDGGMMAANLYRQLALTHLAGEELRRLAAQAPAGRRVCARPLDHAAAAGQGLSPGRCGAAGRAACRRRFRQHRFPHAALARLHRAPIPAQVRPGLAPQIVA